MGVCPTDALSIDIFDSHEPKIDESKCINCGYCLEVCPGQGYPVEEWSRRYCDEQTQIIPERGPVRHYWLGHSTDPAIRAASASGGIATSLLLHLLESGEVDAVVVVGMENDRPVARLTSDPEIVRGAMMSKYGPVPLLATVIPELRREPRRIAMTVTPCQLGGWMRATQRIPALKESTVLTIGLFCGQIQSYDSLTSIAATLGVRYPGDANFVAWRYGPYPGCARFECADGSAAEKPLYSWLDVAVPYFSLHRCFLCPDGGNWLADMTLGDIHAGGDDETVIVCRTQKGQDILESAQEAGRIFTREMTRGEVEASVIKGITRSKLLPAIARNAWLSQEGRPAPEFDYAAGHYLRGKSKRMALLWVWKYRLTFWARKGWRRQFLLQHPWLLEKSGHFLYYFPATIPGWQAAVRTAKFLAGLLKKNGKK